MTSLNNPVIAVVGLGYVGLPLAVEFAKKFPTIGFDLSRQKIDSYKKSIDPTGEIADKLLSEVIDSGRLLPTSCPEDLSQADYFIVAVPTPVDDAHIPDFGPLISASTIVGQHMKSGAIIVFESTVYPGATEEVCIPILEKNSGFVWKKDFYVGYSPERINPGDREHTLTKIVKVVSGDTSDTLQKVAALYGEIIVAGVHKANSIKVAEAAKVIENTQRDLNIALMNELAVIFDRLNIDTQDVLEAAGTKWNFLRFKPGLVGGHCIGVDPYYLTHKAEMLGYQPQVILAGRRINDGMGKFIAEKTIKKMIQQGLNIKGGKILILGLTFKENCSDLRNSKVIDVIRELNEYGCSLFVHDPMADPKEAISQYGVTLSDWNELPKDVDAIIFAVPHASYLKNANEFHELLKDNGVLIDVKSCLTEEDMKEFSPNICIWRL